MNWPDRSIPRADGPAESSPPVADDARRVSAVTPASAELTYRSPRWLPDRHSQTIWPALYAPKPPVTYRRERWDTPDGDFIDVDFVMDRATGDAGLAADAAPNAAGPDQRPLLLLFHGLEGSSQSHYALSLMAAARDRGWRGAVAHFRGCSGEPNRLARAYHSGDSEEIDWVVRTCQQRQRAAGHTGPIYACGISLGGNALLKWLGERGDAALPVVRAAAGISAPQDLEAGAVALARGFSLLYTRNFLRTLKYKSVDKLARFPGLYDRRAVLAARDFHDFDELVTAPLHGFAGCRDYWQRSSSKQFLPGIRVPTLVLNALNDPFVPADVLARPDQVSAAVSLDYPVHGGHVGFLSGGFPGRLDWLSRRVFSFFDQV